MPHSRDDISHGGDMRRVLGEGEVTGEDWTSFDWLQTSLKIPPTLKLRGTSRRASRTNGDKDWIPDQVGSDKIKKAIKDKIKSTLSRHQKVSGGVCEA
jgi:hypothetical protein